MKRPSPSYRPREGDVFYVLARAKYDVDPQEDRVHIELVASSHTRARIALDAIEAIKSRDWRVDDLIEDAEGESGTVIAVHENFLWIKRKKDNRLVTASGDALELLRSSPTFDEVPGRPAVSMKDLPEYKPEDPPLCFEDIVHIPKGSES